MHAVVYAGPEQVDVRDVPEPGAPGPGRAVVQVALSGICGTDLHAVRGHLPGLTPGTILGHEFVGEVIATGEGVQRVHQGDTVMASDFAACGRCQWCDRTENWHCPHRAFFGTGTSFGPALAGAQAERVLVPHADTTLTPLPTGCSAEAAILIGDNLATAWTAVARERIEPGGCLAVIGGGAVGQLVALCAQVVAAGTVIVVEPNADRRAFAEAHGSVAVAPDAAAQLVRAVTGGDGADVVVDAVGGNSVLDAAFSLVRAGGHVVSVGVHSADQWAMPVAAAFSNEITISFAIGNSIPLRRQLAGMVAGGTIDPTVVIDSRIGLDDAPHAYASLLAQRSMKTIIDLRVS